MNVCPLNERVSQQYDHQTLSFSASALYDSMFTYVYAISSRKKVKGDKTRLIK